VEEDAQRGFMTRKGIVVTIAVAFILLSAIPAEVFAQDLDPLVGTWNLRSSLTQAPFIGVQTFNMGGTTVEYDTSGTNPASSPGESIVLGNWKKAADGSYDIKEQNYIYDSSGNLKYVAITVFKISIDPTKNHFSGGGVTHFNFCSVDQCPGPLFASTPLQLTGTRF
jgi:hypothetical protein